MKKNSRKSLDRLTGLPSPPPGPVVGHPRTAKSSTGSFRIIVPPEFGRSSSTTGTGVGRDELILELIDGQARAVRVSLKELRYNRQLWAFVHHALRSSVGWYTEINSTARMKSLY